MFGALIRTRFSSLIAMFLKRGTKKKNGGKGKKILFSILIIYILAAFGIMFGSLFMSICKPFGAVGLDWLYLAIIGILAFVLSFIGSVLITQNQLYDAKDNDLLLSMPIPAKYILGSRTLMLLGLNYIYEILVIVPGGIVYCIERPVTVVGTISFVIAFLILPIMVMAFSAFFGWIIALISSRMRNKNLTTMIFSLALLGAYMYFYMRINTYIQQLIANGEAIGMAIKHSAFPFYYLGMAIANGNLLYLIIFALCCIIPFGIVYWLLTLSFIKIATTKRGMKKIAYKKKTLKVSGVRKAFINKEAMHFLGNPMYMMNAGLGLVFMVIGAVSLAIKSSSIMGFFNVIGLGVEFVGPLVCIGMCMMASMTIISAPTISLEGANLWIAQSSPVLGKDILLAKSDMHILMSLPFIIISGLICVFALKLSIVSCIMIFALPIGTTVFNALFGVAVNLKFPKFDWTNETVAVKQGMAPIAAMLGSMATVILPIIVYFMWLMDFMKPEIFILLYFVFFVILAVLVYIFLITKGVKIFKELQN